MVLPIVLEAEEVFQFVFVELVEEGLALGDDGVGEVFLFVLQDKLGDVVHHNL